jgi:hypothetical protein
MQLSGAIFIAAALLLAGCNVGPGYTRPSVPAARAYKEQPPAEFKESHGWQQAQPGDDKIRADRRIPEVIAFPVQCLPYFSPHSKLFRARRHLKK